VVGLISEKLAGIYTKAEDKYFDLLDFLDGKGIPVYKYSDFFENRGIPSFVVTIAIIVLILLLLTIALTYQGPDVSELTLSLRDADGKALQNVKIVVTDEKGEVLFDGIKSDGDKVALKRGLYDGEKISITASIDGYQPKTLEFTVGKENTVPKISFEKAFEGIEAKLRIIDKETKTIISGATVIANTSDLSFEFNDDGNGLYKKAGVPGGVTLLLKINAEGYNNYEQQAIFNEGETRTVELSPSNQGFVGKASVAIVVKNTDGKAVDDAKVTIYDKQTNIVILSNYTSQGTVMGEIQTGIPLRIVVEKEGYLTYDSDKEGASITIREKEKQIVVTIKQGGQNLHVTVLDSSSGFAVDGATVQVFKENSEFFAEQTSTVSGADFNGLDPADIIYVTAYREGYLPAREKVAVSSTEEVKLIMEKVTATNSARLDIYAIDAQGTSVNGVKIFIYEITDGNMLPYGVAGLETSFAGYASVTVAVDKTYDIYGLTDVMEGQETIEVKKGEADKKVYLQMQKKANVIEMKFIDAYGKDVYGTATISGLDGTTIYDGNIVDSRVFFDAEQREVVEVEVLLVDGNVFTENVTVKGKDYIEVVVYNKDSGALSPLMEFIGIEDEQGTEVKGITPGAFYWAKFNVVFPKAATKGGVHFRAGADNVAFSDSEKFAVYDLSLQGAQLAQSNSYTPTPSPGNETVDRANAVSQGEKSKWIEGVITQPNGTYAVKVKVRAEDFTEGKAQLHYRAWTVVNSDYYRMPEDVEIGNVAFTESKSGLYAETSIQELTLYESLPECKENLCLTTNFIDEDETLIDEAGFEALKDKVYALEIEVTALEADYVQVTATTDGNLVQFTSTQSGSFNFVRESDYNKTGTGASTASAALSLTAEGKEKIRFYFKGTKIGNAQINVKVTGKSTVEKNLQFKVVQEKTLLIELSESQIMAGKNFTVKVLDQGLKGIENALVKIIDKEGKIVKTISGDGSDGKGKNGYYRVVNDLPVGLYTVEVSVPTYATNSVPLLVTTQNVLSFADSIEVKLPLGQKTTMVSELLSNNSEFTVQNITVQTDGEASKEKQNLGESITTSETGLFKITAIAPPALGKEQKQAVQITVTFIGEESDSADETATLTISGLVEGKFLTKISSTVHMTYNRKLDSSCLQVTPSSLVINLLGAEGSTDSDVLEVTNNCDQAVYLKSRVREITKKSYIIVSTEDIDLQQGETKNITVTANNLVERAAAREQSFSYELVYDSNYLKKTIVVNVKTINPAFALSYPPQVTLWLAQSNSQEKAVAAQPLFVTNISSFPVENIGFNVDREYASGANVQLSVEPPGLVSLERGQSINPPKLVFAQASSKISEPVRGKILITGKMGQLNNKAGQLDGYNYYDNYYDGKTSLNSYTPKTTNSYQNTSQTLGMIDVIVYYSGFNCLTANLVSDNLGDFDYLFPVEGGQIAKKVSITNKCAEPVRVIGATPAGMTQQTVNPVLGVPIVASSIMMSLPMVTIGPGEQIHVPMTIITAIPNVNRKNYSVVINAVSEISQTPITSKPFNINIYSGQDMASEHIKAVKLKAKICGTQQEEEITVPKVSDNANCGEAYCDAQQAAKYLEQKIRQIISKAQSQGYSKKNLEETFDCQGTGACTFEEIGMQPEYLDLYLQNDNLSADILQKELNGSDYEASSSTPFRETAGSTGFMVIPEMVDLGFLKVRVLSGYDRTIFLDRELSGCGYYKLMISGAFRAGVDGIDAMTPAISVRAVPQSGKSKLITKECRDSITNVPNFNPIDSGLETGSDYGTWLTTVESDTLLKDVAKEIAKTRYKSEKRVTSGSGNKVRLVQGALSDALAQMCISGGEKKTITVTVDSSIAKATDKTTKDTYSQAIVKLVSDGLTGSFGDNCLIKSGEIYSCVKLTDVANLGRRRIELQTESLPLNAVENCITGTVYSTVPEMLNFDVEPISPSATGKNFSNIGKINITANDNATGPDVKLPSATTATAPIVQSNTTTKDILENTGTETKNPAGTETKTPTGTGTTTQDKPKTTAMPETKIQKISFAETVPTNTPPQGKTPAGTTPSSTAAKNPLKDFYSVEYLGGNIKSNPINNQVELFANQNSKEYRYYRNIKICATAEGSTTTDGVSIFSQANGVQFTVGVRALNQSQPEPDAKKLITVNTGTIHPDDLVKFICANSLEGKEDYSNYFTITWAQGDQTIANFGDYIEGLKRKGQLESCILFNDKSGYAGTKAYDDPAAKAKGSAVGKYLLTCGVASAACNAATNGVTLLGPVLGVLFDCGLPVATTYKKDLAASSSTARAFYSQLEEWTKPVKDVPLVGSILKTLFEVREDVPDQKTKTGNSQIVIESMIKTLLQKGPSRIFSSYPISTTQSPTAKLWNLGTTIKDNKISDMIMGTTKTTTPKAITDFAGILSDEIVDNGYKTYLDDSFKGSVAARDDFVAELKSRMEKKISDKMNAIAVNEYSQASSLKNKVLTPYASRTINTSFTQAGIDSVKEADGEFTKLLLEADASGRTWLHKLTGSDPSDSLETVISKTKGELKTALTNRLALADKLSFKGELDKIIKSHAGGKFSDAENEIKALYQKTTSQPMSSATWNQIKDTTIKLDGTVVKYDVQLDLLVKDMLGTKVNTADLEGMAKLLKQGADKEMKPAMEAAIKKAQTAGSVFKTRVGTAAREFGKGILCGYLANAAGEWAYEKELNGEMDALKKKSFKLLNQDMALTKNKQYELKIAKTLGEWSIVLNEKDPVKDAKEMSTKISANNGKVITWQAINPKEKDPSERPLSLWKLKTDMAAAKDSMLDYKYPYEEKEYQKQISTLKDSKIEELIYNYTAVDGSKIDGAEEGIVIATMLYDWDNIRPGLEKEVKEYNGALKDKVTKLIAERTIANGKLTKESVKKVFKVGEKEADKFLKVLSFWQMVSEDKSPNIQPAS